MDDTKSSCVMIDAEKKKQKDREKRGGRGRSVVRSSTFFVVVGDNGEQGTR